MTRLCAFAVGDTVPEDDRASRYSLALGDRDPLQIGRLIEAWGCTNAACGCGCRRYSAL